MSENANTGSLGVEAALKLMHYKKLEPIEPTNGLEELLQLRRQSEFVKESIQNR